MKVLKRIGIIVLILSIMILILFKKDSVSNNVITKYELKEENISLERDTSSKENISVDEENIINNLNEIGSNIRNFGSEGSQITANFFKKKLNEYNYNVKLQEFDIYEQNMASSIRVKNNSEYFNLNPYNSASLGKGRNIIVESKNNSNNKKTLYLSAHYDSTDYTTGVIDNATGCVVLLELAKVLQNFDGDINIKFLFLDAEEYFRYGSKYFVSKLSDEEKNNIIGCINVDMVGEKNAGNIVMQTTSGNKNIISSLISKSLGDKFLLSEGGFSDDLSFYMGEIPVVTFANEKSNFNLDLEDKNTQINNVDTKIIKDFCEIITNFLSNLELNNYNEGLKAIEKVESSEKDIRIINGFELKKIEESYINNGFDVKFRYIYEKDKLNFSFSEFPVKFISKEVYKNYIQSNSDNTWFYEINENKILVKNDSAFYEFSGNIPINELVEVVEVFFKEEYYSLFEKYPLSRLIN
ncbi:M28 family peptidase [Clostridium perfringens]|uniref:M28 family peptidase n=3 Tax=Clostridium perfringens TaxID=1502 RepID=UPI0018A9B16C|nr:M28 family peptidase [Clostridium perfringens]EIF6156834.1 M28 family peptidase [Clostridium perfringens]EJT6612685.1 M28 family peptidase [Clostridium perfringens]ELC8344372.1 M28 family peptidase [Clostridium perfringens]ELC8347440.1 M28 family peptidase [Clostridium perfringens]ELC8439792.1 M28 family peptidase [Clostridium perfringens]